MIVTGLWPWLAFVGFVVAALAVDLTIVHRRPHAVSTREAVASTAVWVALAMIFAVVLALTVGRSAAVPFLAGYVVEESLSADNVFVIALVLQFFRVPPSSEHRLLVYGVLGVLLMRGLFIGVGAELLRHVDWALYAFGAFLLATAVRMLTRRESDFAGEQNVVVRIARRLLPVTAGYRADRFFAIDDGRLSATPLFLALLVVEVTDLAFATDSIPAVFGITRDPFLVFSSNVLAVLGLRSLYFVLAAGVRRLWLLRPALAAILGFIGAKMLLERVVQISTLQSLACVGAILFAAVAGSLAWPREAATPAAEADRGTKPVDRRDARRSAPE